MSKLLRYDHLGDTVFITAVTKNRIRLLREWENLLLYKFLKYHKEGLYDLIAWSILPDHFHIITKPIITNISEIMRKIKMSFSSDYRKQNQIKQMTIWQKRFYDHIIRDERDLNNHIDYIHYNPVKHGLVNKPHDWRYSSFMNYLNRGYYDMDWGVNCELKFDGDYGE